ncbi:MAG: hypothetical protein NTX03_09700 [Bacteroidetes bacterium]|nr:hypothetical protein [Bacteroidota bacterium]
MKKKSKFKNLLPPFLYNSLLAAKDSLDFSLKANAKLLQPNATLKNTGKGKRAFLIATGPSIKTQDLSVLKGEDCFTLSNFFLHKDLQTINPKFHFFAPYHPPLEKDNFYGWMQQADEILPPNTQMFLGDTDAAEIAGRGVFKKRKKFYLHMSPHVSVGRVDICKPILGPQTGPLMILPVLLYMGYEKIYLLGCDHTVLRDFKKQIQHFFDGEKDPRKNASNGEAWQGNILDSMHNTLNVFVQYQKYKDAMAAHYPNAKIINLSNDSWLDLFEFGRLEEVMKK